MTKLTYKIENIVATAELGVEINLQEIAPRLPAAQYNPSIFPGIILRLRKPKVGVLLFRTGKVVVAGAKSIDQLKEAVKNLVKLLESNGVKITSPPKVKIENIVVSGSLGYEIDIEKAALILDYTFYEPEQFPGLVYRDKENRVVFLLFSTGRFVCAGGRDLNKIDKAIHDLYNRLRELGLLLEEAV